MYLNAQGAWTFLISRKEINFKLVSGGEPRKNLTISLSLSLILKGRCRQSSRRACREESFSVLAHLVVPKDLLPKNKKDNISTKSFFLMLGSTMVPRWSTMDPRWSTDPEQFSRGRRFFYLLTRMWRVDRPLRMRLCQQERTKGKGFPFGSFRWLWRRHEMFCDRTFSVDCTDDSRGREYKKSSTGEEETSVLCSPWIEELGNLRTSWILCSDQCRIIPGSSSRCPHPTKRSDRGKKKRRNVLCSVT